MKNKKINLIVLVITLTAFACMSGMANAAIYVPDGIDDDNVALASAPVISNIDVVDLLLGATIDWETDVAATSPPLVSNEQVATTYDPSTLSHNIKYYWKIVATDNYGASTTGPLWDFTSSSEETILDYYRGVDGVVSTSELLTAITDWAAGTAPSGFTEALTTTQLLTLITEWAS